MRGSPRGMREGVTEEDEWRMRGFTKEDEGRMRGSPMGSPRRMRGPPRKMALKIEKVLG